MYFEGKNVNWAEPHPFEGQPVRQMRCLLSLVFRLSKAFFADALLPFLVIGSTILFLGGTVLQLESELYDAVLFGFWLIALNMAVLSDLLALLEESADDRKHISLARL